MLSDPPRGYGGRSQRSVTARRTLPNAAMQRGSGGGGQGRGQMPRLAYPKGRGQVPRLVYPKERGRVPRLLYPKTLSICRRSKFVRQLVSHFAGLSEGHIRGYLSCVRVRGVLCFGVACVGSMRLAFRKCGGEAGPVPMPVLRLLLLVLDTKNKAERVRHRARVVQQLHTLCTCYATP